MSNIGLQILYIMAFSCLTGFVTALLYPDTNLWEPDIIIIMAVVFLIDFVWFAIYLLR